MKARFEHSGRFNAAVLDLHDAPFADRDYAISCKWAARAIAESQRFYLPEANWVLTNKVVTPELKELMRLPYSLVSVLSEVSLLRPTADGGNIAWRISLASHPTPEVREQLMPPLKSYFHDIPNDAFEDGRAWLIMCAIELPNPLAPRQRTWIMEPGAAVVHHPPTGDGFMIYPLMLGDTETEAAYRAACAGEPIDEIRGDVAAIQNLCVMLSLHNVHTRHRAAPDSLQRKRTARNKLPLYSYRVLVVDGEAWDDTGHRTTSGNTGIGKRSHLRRGHIRRLHAHTGDERRIWVRATYVHGTRPGFVAKDYDVRTTRAQGEQT